MKTKINLIIYSLLIMVIFPTLTGCSKTPDCGSKDAQELVAKIAKDNKAMLDYIQKNSQKTKDINESLRISKMSFGCADCIQVHQKQSDLRENIKAEEKKCEKLSDLGDSFYCGSMIDITTFENTDSFKNSKDAHIIYAREKIIPLIHELRKTIDEESAAYKKDSDNKEAAFAIEKDKYLADLEIAKSVVNYSLINIILTEKHEDVNVVFCKAKLNADMPNFGAALEEISYKLEKNTEGVLNATVFGL